MAETASPCSSHPNQPAAWTCALCQRPLCLDCQPIAWQQAIYCPSCMREQERRRDTAQAAQIRRRQHASIARMVGTTAALLAAGAAVWLIAPVIARRADAQAQAAWRERYARKRPAAPPISVPDVDGRPITLSQFHGRVVLLDFWASWCGPCRAALPELRRLHERFAPKGLVLLGINLDEEQAAMRAVLTAEKITWPQIQGASAHDLSARYGVSGIPTTVLIDRDGRLFVSGHWPGRRLAQATEFLLSQAVTEPAADSTTATRR